MSTSTLHPAIRSRWMDWKPKARILTDTAESERTKPSKPGFVGFEGSTHANAHEIRTGFVGFVVETSGESPEIRGEPDAAEPAAMVDAFNAVIETTAGAPAASPLAPEREQRANIARPAADWADWRAAVLNRLFQDQGMTGQPGRITAATVRHGEAANDLK